MYTHTKPSCYFVGNCFDLFDDCTALIEETPEFCALNLDGQALRGCRKTCGQCEAEKGM